MKKIMSVVLCLVFVFTLACCGEAEKTAASKKPQKKKEREIVWHDYSDVNLETFMPDLNIEARVDLSRYDDDIAAFEAAPKQEGGIIFYGSSGFTRWSKKWGNEPLETVLTSSKGEQVCINHGFGGSTMHELCHYYERAVKPWKPKALVVTSFINDSAAHYTDDEMLKLVQWLFERARTDFPGIHLYITDWRPTAKDRTDQEVNRYLNFNKKLLAYAKAHKDTTVVEMSTEPYFYRTEDEAGSYKHIKKTAFVADEVHYTQETYDKVAETFRRYLLKDLG